MRRTLHQATQKRAVREMVRALKGERGDESSLQHNQYRKGGATDARGAEE